MASESTVLHEIKKAVAAKKTEQAQVNAAQVLLARHGSGKLPKISTTRNEHGETVRIYMWKSTPAGDFVLVTGPKFEGDVHALDDIDARKAGEEGIYVKGAEAPQAVEDRVERKLKKAMTGAVKKALGSHAPKVSHTTASAPSADAMRARLQALGGQLAKRLNPRRRNPAYGVGFSWASPQGRREIVDVQRVADGRTLYAIKTEGVRFTSLLPLDQIGSEVARDEANVASRARQRATTDAESAAHSAHVASRDASLAPFLATFPTPIARGKAEKALRTTQGVNGKIDTRHRHIERMVRDGWHVSADGKKLLGPDGRFLTQSDVTKTGLDYARFLSTKSNPLYPALMGYQTYEILSGPNAGKTFQAANDFKARADAVAQGLVRSGSQVRRSRRHEGASRHNPGGAYHVEKRDETVVWKGRDHNEAKREANKLARQEGMAYLRHPDGTYSQVEAHTDAELNDLLARGQISRHEYDRQRRTNGRRRNPLARSEIQQAVALLRKIDPELAGWVEAHPELAEDLLRDAFAGAAAVAQGAAFEERGALMAARGHADDLRLEGEGLLESAYDIAPAPPGPRQLHGDRSERHPVDEEGEYLDSPDDGGDDEVTGELVEFIPAPASAEAEAGEEYIPAPENYQGEGGDFDLSTMVGFVTDPRSRTVLTAAYEDNPEKIVPMTGLQMDYSESPLLPDNIQFRTREDAESLLNWLNEKRAESDAAGKTTPGTYWKTVITATWDDGSKWRGRFDVNGKWTTDFLFGDSHGGGITWENTTSKGTVYQNDPEFGDVPELTPETLEALSDDRAQETTASRAVIAASVGKHLEKAGVRIGAVYSVADYIDNTDYNHPRHWIRIALKDGLYLFEKKTPHSDQIHGAYLTDPNGLAWLADEMRHATDTGSSEWPGADAMPKNLTKVLGDAGLDRGAGPENAAIKAVLEEAAPSVKWRTKSSSGTGYGWSSITGTGGTAADRKAGAEMLFYMGLSYNQNTEQLDGHGERYNVVIPPEYVQTALSGARGGIRTPKQAIAGEAVAVDADDLRPGDLVIAFAQHVGKDIIDVWMVNPSWSPTPTNEPTYIDLRGKTHPIYLGQTLESKQSVGHEGRPGTAYYKTTGKSRPQNVIDSSVHRRKRSLFWKLTGAGPKGSDLTGGVDDAKDFTQSYLIGRKAAGQLIKKYAPEVWAASSGRVFHFRPAGYSQGAKDTYDLVGGSLEGHGGPLSVEREEPPQAHAYDEERNIIASKTASGVVVAHTPEEGTTARGDTRPVKDILKAYGMRWYGAGKFWYVPRSRGKSSSPIDMDALRRELNAADGGDEAVPVIDVYGIGEVRDEYAEALLGAQNAVRDTPNNVRELRTAATKLRALTGSTSPEAESILGAIERLIERQLEPVHATYEVVQTTERPDIAQTGGASGYGEVEGYGPQIEIDDDLYRVARKTRQGSSETWGAQRYDYESGMWKWDDTVGSSVFTVGKHSLADVQKRLFGRSESFNAAQSRKELSKQTGHALNVLDGLREMFADYKKKPLNSSLHEGVKGWVTRTVEAADAAEKHFLALADAGEQTNADNNMSRELDVAREAALEIRNDAEQLWSKANSEEAGRQGGDAIRASFDWALNEVDHQLLKATMAVEKVESGEMRTASEPMQELANAIKKTDREWNRHPSFSDARIEGKWKAQEEKRQALLRRLEAASDNNAKKDLDVQAKKTEAALRQYESLTLPIPAHPGKPLGELLSGRDKRVSLPIANGAETLVLGAMEKTRSRTNEATVYDLMVSPFLILRGEGDNAIRGHGLDETRGRPPVFGNVDRLELLRDFSADQAWSRLPADVDLKNLLRAASTDGNRFGMAGLLIKHLASSRRAPVPATVRIGSYRYTFDPVSIMGTDGSRMMVVFDKDETLPDEAFIPRGPLDWSKNDEVLFRKVPAHGKLAVATVTDGAVQLASEEGPDFFQILAPLLDKVQDSPVIRMGAADIAAFVKLKIPRKMDPNVVWTKKGCALVLQPEGRGSLNYTYTPLPMLAHLPPAAHPAHVAINAMYLQDAFKALAKKSECDIVFTGGALDPILVLEGGKGTNPTVRMAYVIMPMRSAEAVEKNVNEALSATRTNGKRRTFATNPVKDQAGLFSAWASGTHARGRPYERSYLDREQSDEEAMAAIDRAKASYARELEWERAQDFSGPTPVIAPTPGRAEPTFRMPR